MERLAEDHALSQTIGQICSQLPWVNQVLPVKTNIVIIQLEGNLTSAEYVPKLTQKGIMCAPFGPQYIRFVTHLNVGDDHLAQFEKLIKQI